MDFEEVLKNIYDDKITIEREKLKIDEELKNASILREKIQKEASSSEEKANKIIQDAKLEARELLLDAKEDINEMIREINKIKKDKDNEKDLNSYRNKINEKIKNIRVLDNTSQKESPSETISSDEIIPGNTVFVTTLNQEATILSHVSKSGEVLLQIGSLKTNMPINVLKPIKQNKNTPKQTISYANSSKTKSAKTEINVIGYNVEEATFLIDKFLDDASLARLETVRIVHGKGTGKLRNGIHTFLKKNPHVKSFRLGTFGEGEMGVTVVTIKGSRLNREPLYYSVVTIELGSIPYCLYIHDV